MTEHKPSSLTAVDPAVLERLLSLPQVKQTSVTSKRSRDGSSSESDLDSVPASDPSASTGSVFSARASTPHLAEDSNEGCTTSEERNGEASNEFNKHMSMPTL